MISQDLEKYKKQYPNDDIVRLQQETIITIKLNNGAFTIHKEVYEEDLYLNNSANYNSKRSISYSTFFNLDKIEASSFSKLDGKYVENKVVDFNEKNNLNDSFYDDSKEVGFIYPKLTKGSKTSLKLTYDIKNPRFLSAFYFGDFYPIINNKVTIIADKNIQFTFKSFQLNNGTKITFKKKKKGTNYVYTWTTKNTKKFEIESNAPNYKTILPHIIPIITSYQQNGKTKKLLDGVEGLYSWYYSLVENINKEETDPALITLVEELTKGKESDIEKVKAIYYWTQQNIKYIAFEYALGGFIPREANEVFQKKYGDCKDNSSILYKMLEIAGLQGNLTWIGTRKIPYTYEEVPTPAVDNHMILTYENKNNTYYLDATGRYIQIEYPSSFIQGKEALIANGNNFKVKKIPVVPAHLNKVVDTTYIQISNRDIIGTSNSTFSGYIKNNLFYNLENTRKEADVKELYNKRFLKGSNKFLVKSFKEENKFSYDKDFSVSYNFSIQDYVQNIGSEIFINPHFNKIVSSVKTKEDRKYGIEFDYKRQFSYTNIIEIPDGYEVSYLPTSVSYSNDLISIDLSYSTDKNKIVCKQDVVFNFIKLNKEQQQKVNTFVEKTEKASKEIIILKKK
ncbi:DUF3857 and transglutaminase domain-containing protein [Flavobacteriaceae bacterium]|nr:DUF3857 and transglutaminase domain-containing protein [Flavobacteriaceae bacterium]